MLAAHKRQLTSGDYMFFNVDLFNASSYGKVNVIQLMYLPTGSTITAKHLCLYLTYERTIPLHHERGHNYAFIEKGISRRIKGLTVSLMSPWPVQCQNGWTCLKNVITN